MAPEAVIQRAQQRVDMHLVAALGQGLLEQAPILPISPFIRRSSMRSRWYSRLLSGCPWLVRARKRESDNPARLALACTALNSFSVR